MKGVSFEGAYHRHIGVCWQSSGRVSAGPHGLAGCGHSLWPSIRNIQGFCGQLEMYPAELSRLPVVEFVLDQSRPDMIFHLAAMAVTGRSWRDPAMTLQINAGMQANVLQAVVNLGLDCRVVVIGSSEEYGAALASDGPVDEESRFRTAKPLCGEQGGTGHAWLAVSSQPGLDTVRVRPFNHIGPRQGLGFVVPDFASQVARIEAGSRPCAARGQPGGAA